MKIQTIQNTEIKLDFLEAVKPLKIKISNSIELYKNNIAKNQMYFKLNLRVNNKYYYIANIKYYEETFMEFFNKNMIVIGLDYVIMGIIRLTSTLKQYKECTLDIEPLYLADSEEEKLWYQFEYGDDWKKFYNKDKKHKKGDKDK